MTQSQDSDDTEVVVLTSEDGEDLSFEVLGILEVDGKEYALLTPEGVSDDPEGIDVHIFGYEKKSDGTEAFSDIDDSVFEKVRAAAEVMFDEDDEETDDPECGDVPPAGEADYT